MREILFRGFVRNDNGKQIIPVNGVKVKGDWVYWDEFGRIKNEKGSVDVYKIDHGNHQVETFSFIRTIKPLLIAETVGEFTGLTDKNGKKVFEGDIILFSHPAYKADFTVAVRWNKDEVGFEAVNGGWIDCLGYDSEFYEVIGNIHDNPELLEV